MVGSLIFLPLSDYVGRRTVVWYGFFVHCALLLLIVFTLSKSNFIYMIYIYMFVFGVKASMTA